MQPFFIKLNANFLLMFFESNGYTLHYSVSGNGPNTLLAFHGFGQNEKVWKVFDQTLSQFFTTYSFDHFYHGKSKTPTKKKALDFIPPLIYTQIFQEFLAQKQISNYWMLGYSLGGKSVLHLTTYLNPAPKGIILLAPDGIRESPWYTFVSRTKIGLWTYKQWMLREKLFDSSMQMLEKLNLLNPSLFRFMHTTLDSKKKRAHVLFTWKNYAQLSGADKKTYTRILSNKIKCLIITGKFDPIIPASIGRIFTSKAKAKHVEWSSGHDLLKPKLEILLKKELEDLLSISTPTNNPH